ncbi:asparagine synthetase B family protein [Prochlorococcus marinus]|uniref:asparagine synthetase B family protein n=1 Tax=Prochlorococcus marinus TaxID=1219 RepID=UPI001ADA9438|nr:asparagine synthetase B [Prochlorococcus marinus]MBO8217697.1 asparagine synthetase B [Prochlorococcus marinus XMU1405]MBW3040860.1 hypothetical protein [Prochlorococcus marinus str. MU1405]MBW3048320.1 hypothetical protein [Prochlorococcus marinus str. MU1406]
MCGFIVTSKNFSINTLKEISENHISYRGSIKPLIKTSRYSHFVFSRLPIVDVSNYSNQPYIWQDISIVFNGELYNYKDLKDELINKYGIKFTGKSDVEVFLKGFITFGPKIFFKKAIGMWAYVIEDKESNIFWGRDEYGIKPLYFVLKNKNISLSSSLPALVQLKDLKINDFSKESLKTFIVYGFLDQINVPLYKDISCAKPGFTYTLKKDSPLKIEENKFEERNIKFNDIRTVLDSVIENQIPEEVDFSIALSGGLDSNILAYTIAKKNKNFSALSLELQDSAPEYNYIKQTIKDLKINHEFIKVDSDDVFNECNDIIQKLGIPMRSSQPVYQSFLRKRANELGSKVFFTGDGADEIFGGYVQGFYYFLKDNFSKVNLNEFQDFLNAKNKLNLEEVLSSIEEKCKVFKLSNNWINLFTYKSNKLPLEPKNLYEYMNFRLYMHPMPYWLSTEDVVSLKNQIETRVPFLDQRIVFRSKFQDINSLYLKGKNKFQLRQAYKDLPAHIINLQRKYPRPADTRNLVYSVKAQNAIKSFINSSFYKELNISKISRISDLYQNDMTKNNPENTDNWFRMLTCFFLLN